MYLENEIRALDPWFHNAIENCRVRHIDGYLFPHPKVVISPKMQFLVISDKTFQPLGVATPLDGKWIAESIRLDTYVSSNFCELLFTTRVAATLWIKYQSCINGWLRDIFDKRPILTRLAECADAS